MERETSARANPAETVPATTADVAWKIDSDYRE